MKKGLGRRRNGSALGDPPVLTWTIPTKELDHPYCAAIGTTATDMTTRSALQSSMMAATSATTLARSGNADATAGRTALATAAAAGTGTGPTLSKLAQHVATTSPRQTRGPTPPSELGPPLTRLLPLMLAAQASPPSGTDEVHIRSRAGAPKPTAPTLVDLYLTGLAEAFTDTHDLTTGAIVKLDPTTCPWEKLRAWMHGSKAGKRELSAQRATAGIGEPMAVRRRCVRRN
jgi:hypothetical protein